MCWGNYATFDGLMNGANGSLKASTTYCEKTIIWIMFQNYKIGTLTKKKYSHYYNNKIESKWIPISSSVSSSKNHSLFSWIITK
jgi:hypothetical protein